MSALEIILEPGVLPRGTLDPRSLDAPRGSVAPAVRVERHGRVVRLPQEALLSPALSGDPE